MILSLNEFAPASPLMIPSNKIIYKRLGHQLEYPSDQSLKYLVNNESPSDRRAPVYQALINCHESNGSQSVSFAIPPLDRRQDTESE